MLSAATTVPSEIVTILCDRYAAHHPPAQDEPSASYFGAMSKAVYRTVNEGASALSFTAVVKRPCQGMSAAASRRVARPEAGV
jgi:hypothetical protein